MTAINNLMQYVTGDLIVDCDSDDYFTSKSFSHNPVPVHPPVPQESPLQKLVNLYVLFV